MSLIFRLLWHKGCTKIIFAFNVHPQKGEKLKSVRIRFNLRANCFFYITRRDEWTKKLDQSNLFTTVSSLSDLVSKWVNICISYSQLRTILHFAELQVNKVDVLQRGSCVSLVVHMVYKVLRKKIGQPMTLKTHEER